MTITVEPQTLADAALLALTCPDFCNGDCDEWNDQPGNLHHTTGFEFIEVDGVEWSISTTRSDENGAAGPHVVNMLSLWRGAEMAMSASDARQLAAMLLNAADVADPLPQGVLAVPAGQVRIGDEIHTPDGWQHVNGLLFFPDANQASIFTPERDDVDSDGWQHGTYEPIKIRRRIHGSCAIAFVEPIR